MNKIEVLKSTTFWRRQMIRFRNPDFHGVSTNYIAQKTKLLSSLADLQYTNFQVNKKLLEEGAQVSNQIAKETSVKTFPDIWDVESNLASFLYAYVMEKKPLVVVETGVANGFSTKILMRALEQTGGELHSFDVRRECSLAYQGSGNWNFHLVPMRNQKSFFQDSTSQMDVDLWFHDGDHSFMWQQFEYNLASSRLAPNGVVISDDVDSSEAWMEFCVKKEMENLCVFDSRKIFGLARRKSHDLV